MYLTMRQILVLTELREQLAGKCGGVCPHWHCDNCIEHFHFIQATRPNLNCPCNRGCNPEEIFLHLDELIGEAK